RIRKGEGLQRRKRQQAFGDVIGKDHHQRRAAQEIEPDVAFFHSVSAAENPLLSWHPFEKVIPAGRTTQSVLSRVKIAMVGWKREGSSREPAYTVCSFETPATPPKTRPPQFGQKFRCDKRP